MWDAALASKLQPGDTLLWIHTKRSRFPEMEENDPKLQRIVTIKSIQGSTLKTDFGNYKIEDGKNTEIACGCKRFCDCYGNVHLLH